LPGCKSKCGDVDTQYPFGTTAGYRPSFKFMVTCHRHGQRSQRPSYEACPEKRERTGTGCWRYPSRMAQMHVSSTVFFFNAGDGAWRDSPSSPLPVGRSCCPPLGTASSTLRVASAACRGGCRRRPHCQYRRMRMTTAPLHPCLHGGVDRTARPCGSNC
jgi:hypothetical protein